MFEPQLEYFITAVFDSEANANDMSKQNDSLHHWLKTLLGLTFLQSSIIRSVHQELKECRTKRRSSPQKAALVVQESRARLPNWSNRRTARVHYNDAIGVTCDCTWAHAPRKTSLL